MQIVVPDDLGSGTLDGWIEAAAELDKAGYDIILFEAAHAKDPLDALSIAAYCATTTQRIGLCVTVDTTTVEPFTFARGLATLDHLSGGRASWRCVGDTDTARAQEFVTTVSALLVSWGKDALVEQHEDGILSDANHVNPVHHEGPFFFSRGPLNIPQPPQGVPPLIALYSDAIQPRADLVPDTGELLHCSLATLPNIAAPRGVTNGALLRDRIGIH